MATLLATKSDLTSLRNELKQEIAAPRNELEQEIESSRTGLRLELQLLQSTMTVRLGSITVVGLGLLFAALKLT